MPDSPSRGAVLISGASTGIGRACTEHLDGLGFTVFAGVRKQSDADSLRGAKSKKHRRRRGRVILLIVAAGAALALSEGLRKKVLDALFGAEEEFDYTSTTAPAAPAPETEATPAA